MSKSVANVVIATDTFQTVIERVNTLADAMTNEVVTVSPTTAGAISTGNGSVNGSFMATDLIAVILRGGTTGNTQAYGNLQIGFSNSTVSSNVTVVGGFTNVTSNNVLIATTNTTLSATNFAINVANTKLTGNVTFAVNTTFNAISFTGNSSQQDLVANVANINITSNLLDFTGNAEVTGTLTITGTAAVVGNLSANTIKFTSTGSLVSNSVTNVYTNNNPQIVDAIDITVNQSAKYTIQVQDAVANEVMMTEISLAYGFSNVYTTEYGTIYSNNQFVSFTANSNTTHARLYGAPLDYTFANNITYKLIRTTLE